MMSAMGRRIPLLVWISGAQSFISRASSTRRTGSVGCRRQRPLLVGHPLVDDSCLDVLTLGLGATSPANTQNFSAISPARSLPVKHPCPSRRAADAWVEGILAYPSLRGRHVH